MTGRQGILDRLNADQRAAMKTGEKTRVATLRLLAAEIKNRQIEIGREVSEADATAIFARAQKQRREAEAQYRAAGRAELADREAAEAEIIQEYLPEPIGEEELDDLIDAAIAETGATGPAQVGAVIGTVMSQVRGRVDGAVVSARVRERLG